MKASPDISIVIVSYNCLEPLKACLNSIEFQNGPLAEVIVVDNASVDGAEAYLKSTGLKVIFPGKNIGFGAGVNLGAKSATGTYLFFLNPDTELPPDVLAELMKFASLNPDFGLISGLLLDNSGQIQISAREFPSRRDFLFGRGTPFFKLGLTGEKKAGYISEIGDKPRQVPAVSGTALFVRRELFERLGGFDERFFMYLEDIDLCRRIAAEGRSVWVLPSAKILHSWRKSSLTRPYFTSYHHHLSIYKYFRKYEPQNWLLNLALAFALVAGLFFSWVFTVLRNRGDE